MAQEIGLHLATEVGFSFCWKSRPRFGAWFGGSGGGFPDGIASRVASQGGRKSSNFTKRSSPYIYVGGQRWRPPKKLKNIVKVPRRELSARGRIKRGGRLRKVQGQAGEAIGARDRIATGTRGWMWFLLEIAPAFLGVVLRQGWRIPRRHSGQSRIPGRKKKFKFEKRFPSKIFAGGEGLATPQKIEK